MCLCNNAIYSTSSQAIELKRVKLLSTVMVSSVMSMMMSSVMVIVMVVVTTTSNCFPDSNSCGHA